MCSDSDIAGVLTDLAHRRGAGASFCPSEAARALSQDWRPLMPRVRAVAAGLARAGQLVATQKGVPVDPLAARGPIRLALVSDAPGSPGPVP
ncbi:DUF3253 domain-containing protein [Meridianimarinicoccus roseus]|uniref:DUF3253 domain-containing protein n=1 Tax=Meridianimarinicoccus roseus TaxID=2072018 RepID=A0A2V2LMZ8_9RHOB|nr:DUF3253 domain-containing protein [Meridianimarinicoccus roseus]PWR04417.1 DUF3253 domain-containing protein [Meridianimarinicoccus roseus]